jgi:hypothetical protein
MPDVQSAEDSLLADALARLDGAVQSLEGALHRRGRRQLQIADLAAELTLMRADRMKLARSLDDAVARGRRLDETRRETEARLDRAIGAIRAVVDGGDEAGG